MTTPPTPDLSTVLYRSDTLTSIPETPGGISWPITEVMHVNLYGDTVTITLPNVALSHEHTSHGTVTKRTYRDKVIAFANYKLVVMQSVRDGWTEADLNTFEPGNPATLTPATTNLIHTVTGAQL